MRLLALLLAGTLLLSACGDDGDDGGTTPPADSDDGAAGGTQLHDDELTSITGVFGGDASLEGGCAWVETDGQRYEVLWPDGYSVDFAADPIALLDGDGTVVAQAGDRLTVEGSVDAERMTICQIGPAFEGTAVTADSTDLPQ